MPPRAFCSYCSTHTDMRPSFCFQFSSVESLQWVLTLLAWSVSGRLSVECLCPSWVLSFSAPFHPDTCLFVRRKNTY